MNTFLDDGRYAVRTLAKRPGFAAAALTTLALGIGANTAIFCVVQGVLLRPLPYPEADRVVQLSEEHPGATRPLPVPLLSNLTIHAWRAGHQTIDELATYGDSDYTLRSSNGTERVRGSNVSASLFSVLRASPAIGRLLEPSDEAPGAAPVVVLSHAFWRERYAADPTALGRTLALNDTVHSIVGVTRPDFYFPNRERGFWVVERVPAVDPNGSATVHEAVGRLRDGATPAQAAAEGTAAARSVPRPFVTEVLFGKGGPVEVKVRTLAAEVTSSIRPALLVLAVGVALVLLIGCVNVANLFLSHGIVRRRELAIRAAIGASRGRLVRQLLTESLVIAVTGGALGLAAGWALIRVLPTLAPADFPRLDDVRLDAVAVLFAAGVSVLAGVLSGLLPALRGAHVALVPALRDGAGASSGARTTRLRAGLIVAESALAVMLLVGAGLLARSFTTLVRVDAGYDAANVLTARIYLPGAERSKAENDAFVSQLLPRVRAWPEVVAAGAGNMSPLGRSTSMSGFDLPGPDGQRVNVSATSYVVTPGYAEALRLRLREGRLFEERDLGPSAQPILVNEEFVRRYLNDGRPVIGRVFPSRDEDVDASIVGIVGNVLKDSLDGTVQNEMYLLPTWGNAITREVHLVVRTSGDPNGIVAPLRALVREIDGTAAVGSVGALATQVSASVGQPRFAAAVLGAVALLGLLLSAIGLYGVLSYNVSERRREIGIRTALGASRSQVLSMIVRQGMGVTLVGLAIGLAGSALLGDLLRGVLFGVQPRDIIAFAMTPIVLLLVAFVACIVPASRAARIDPAEALRAE